MRRLRLPGNLLRWIGLPLAVFGAVWILFQQLQADALLRDQQYALGRFQQAAAGRIAVLREELSDVAEFHNLLRSHLSRSNAPDFARYTQPMLLEHPYVNLIAYAPRLPRIGAPPLRGVEERGIAPFALNTRYPLRLIAPANAMRNGFDLASSRNENLAVLAYTLSRTQNSQLPLATSLFHWPPGDGGQPHVAVVQSLNAISDGPALEGLPAGVTTIWINLNDLVHQVLSPGQGNDPPDMDFEIIDATDSPRVLRPPPRVASGTPVYAESVEFFDRRWLVLASPLDGSQPGTPGSAARRIGQAGLAAAVLAALLVIVLQSRDAWVRRSVRIQTRQQARNNRALTTANARLEQALAQQQGAAEELAAALGRNQALLEHLPYGVLLEEPQGTLSYMNPAAARLLNLGMENIGQPLPTALFSGTLAADGNPLASLLDQEDVCEIRLPHPEGGDAPALLRVSRLPAEGTRQGGIMAVAVKQHEPSVQPSSPTS